MSSRGAESRFRRVAAVGKSDEHSDARDDDGADIAGVVGQCVDDGGAILDVALDEDACRIGIAAATMGALRRLAYRIIAELRGPLSFRRFAERRRANPARLLEICAACR